MGSLTVSHSAVIAGWVKATSPYLASAEIFSGSVCLVHHIINTMRPSILPALRSLNTWLI
jgi:hypothetical protein